MAAVPHEIATWQLDSAHSRVEFAVKHMVMTTVRGRFKELRAKLDGDEQHPEGCCVRVTIAAASVDTENDERDANLRSPDFFDAERFPEITFESRLTEGRLEAGEQFRLIGGLTMHGTTKEITLDCEFIARESERASFSFKGELDRNDWGLRWNQAIEAGGVMVSNKVRVEGKVQFVKQQGS